MTDIEIKIDVALEEISELEDLKYRSQDLLIVLSGTADPRAEQVRDDILDIEGRIEDLLIRVEQLQKEL